MSTKRTHTLIVGASGFLGSNLLERLIRHDLDPIGIGPRAPELSIQIPAFLTGKSYKLELEDLLQQCRSVIYLGGRSKPALGWDTMSEEINTEASRVLDLAAKCSNCGVEQFVFASSGGTIYGRSPEANLESDAARPLNTYGLSKLIAETGLRYISRTTDLNVLVLRISNPYGPRQIVKGGQGFVAAAINAVLGGASLTVWGDGSTVRDFVFIDDVTRAFQLALDHDARFDVLNVSSGIGTPLSEICQLLEKISSRKIKVEYESARSVDVPINILDNTLANKKLGWHPQVGLADGLEATLDWWEEGPISSN